MLQLTNISYAYRRKPALLRGVSASLGVGKVAALLGPNGSGKSTLLKLIAGNLKPATGSVEWCNKLIHSCSSREQALFRAVVTQHKPDKLAFSVRSIVMMGRAAAYSFRPTGVDTKHVNDALHYCDLHELADEMYSTLSGGQQQRVHIARALAQLGYAINAPQQEPKLLLMDEPLNNLDLKQQHAVLCLARSFARKGNTVLIVLHDVNAAAQYADELMLMKDGEILGAGHPEEVMQPELLSYCYGHPVEVATHPILGCPTMYSLQDYIKNQNKEKSYA